jgi:putative FmdB family regulatory protein
MPIYTYRCTSCGVQFDQQQKFSDPPLTRCPECSKKTLQKVFQPVGIVFKGSGFYSTDHRSPSGQGRSTSKEKSGGSEGSAEKPASGDSGSSESKPAAKSSED